MRPFGVANSLPPVTNPAAGPIRVVVIGPPPATRSLGDLLVTLADRGFRLVHEFPDLPAADACLEREAADLVLIAIDASASDALARIRAHPLLAGYVSFIVVDESAREDVARLALKAGAQDYLVRSKLTAARLERSMRWSLERARVEQTLKRESDLLHALLDYLPDKIYFKDRCGRFLRASKSVADWLGADDPAAVIGRTDFDFYTPEHADATFQDEQEVIRSEKPIIGKLSQRTLPDGRTEWSSTTKLPLRDHRQRVVGTFGVTRDLTPVKQLELELAAERNRLRDANTELSTTVEKLRRAHEELQSVQLQLIEAEKLKSIGRLAAGVAHEVKNPLAIISMGLDFLRGHLAGDALAADVLHELDEAVGRADTVVKGLLDYSAPRQLALEPHDLNGIIRTALRLVRGEMLADLHHIETDFLPLPPVPVDRGKVCQVLVNLFTNALHAMPAGGTLTVRTRTEQITGVGDNIAGERSEVFLAGDQVAVVEIADTGPGIPPELLGRIFEPFVTTKPTGKGTGLGMSVVRSIMNLHRGTVTVRNREPRGALVTLLFNANPTPP